MGLPDITIAVLTLIAGVLATAGYGVLSMSPPDFRTARICFILASLCFASIAVVVGMFTTIQPNMLRIAVTAVIGAVALVGLVESLRWVAQREGIELVKPAAAQEQARGGDAKVVGQRSGAEGGRGGDNNGGRGGDAEVHGDGSFARGGDGGNGPTPDGRGGRRTWSQGERLNLATQIWPYGYGGASANTPEYNRRLSLLVQIRQEYFKAFPGDVPYIEAGVDQVPIRWINKRLEELGENWRVGGNFRDGGYVMPSLKR